MDIITDGMTPDDLRAIIEAQAGELSRCYARIGELEEQVKRLHGLMIGYAQGAQWVEAGVTRIEVWGN